jgi:hypothetical protein
MYTFSNIVPDISCAVQLLSIFLKIYCTNSIYSVYNAKKLNSMALVRERTIPTERLPPVGEVSANLCTMLHYKIVPVTNLNKYLYSGTYGTE